MAAITTRSGRTRALPPHVDPDTVLGLDGDGRIVVQLEWMRDCDEPYAFGLTLCCDAWDKGMEGGVYCRACYGGARNADAGNYLFFTDEGGAFLGLDPKV
jgi:hypothetical protein